MNRIERRERGAVLVEAALIMPLIILLIFGLVEFSRAYNTKVTVTHAAREGVRELALHNDSAAAEAVAINAATTLDPASMTFTSGTCDVNGDPVEFTISYPFHYSIPLFGDNTITLESTAVMRCSG